MRGDLSDFRQHLLQWFAASARLLPWRQQPGVYKTVVSEFMLQQTQVETVRPYFERWLRLFPDFGALAAAPEAAVLKAWEGLGYYSRARNLQRAAERIVADGMPQTAAQWQALPGIGPYTAAAIASIAQGEPVAVVDGNVVRVASRLCNDATPIASSADAIRRLQPLLDQWIDPHQPGKFNEAMMELGATCCRKGNPDCAACPVQAFCRAFADGNPSALPVIVRKATTNRSIQRIFCQRDNQLLLVRYPVDAARLAGMTELPLAPVAMSGTPALARSRGIGNERIREQIFIVAGDDPLVPLLSAQPHHVWVPLAGLSSITLSGPHRRWIHQLLDKLN